MPAPEPAFWLLIGSTPAGPFTLATVHDKLAAGEVTWDTRACPVGGGAWLSLRQTPGIGPDAADPSPAPSPAATPLPVAELLPSEPEPGPTGMRPQGPAGSGPAVGLRVMGWVVGLAALGAAGYLVYEAARPLTPREAFDRFDRAKTPAEAKRYATPAFQPVVDAVWGGPDDPDDRVEYTHDGPAPPEFGGHFVGLRGHFFVPEAGRRMRIDAVVHMLDRDGWKVNDFLFLAADGQRVDPPLSLAAGIRGPTTPGGRVAPESQATRVWYENPKNQRAAAFGTFALLKGGGLKVVGGVVLVVGGAIWALLRRANGTARPA